MQSYNSMHISMHMFTKARTVVYERAYWQPTQSCEHHAQDVVFITSAVYIQWLRVIPCTFECRILLSSAKHLLIWQDVTTTTDIHLHYLDVSFTSTASSQEHQTSAFLRRMYTDYRADIYPENSTWSVCHTSSAQFECLWYFSCHRFLSDVFLHFTWCFCYSCEFVNLETLRKADIVLLVWCFKMLPFCFFLSFCILYYYHTARFCNKIFVPFHRIISCALKCEKMCDLRFHDTLACVKIRQEILPLLIDKYLQIESWMLL